MVADGNQLSQLTDGQANIEMFDEEPNYHDARRLLSRLSASDGEVPLQVLLFLFSKFELLIRDF